MQHDLLIVFLLTRTQGANLGEFKIPIIALKFKLPLKHIAFQYPQRLMYSSRSHMVTHACSQRVTVISSVSSRLNAQGHLKVMLLPGNHLLICQRLFLRDQPAGAIKAPLHC